MLKRFLLFVVFLFGASPAFAQFTTVTATVTDPNGIPYAGGTMSAVLVPGASGGYTLGGQPYSGRVGPVTLDGNGKFTANFGDVTLITPGSPQWQITIDSNQGGIEPPLGTGPQTFTFTSTGTTISGSSVVNISASLNALAPKLTNFVAGGGTIGSCGTVDAIAYYSAATTLTCDSTFTTNATGILTLTATVPAFDFVSGTNSLLIAATGTSSAITSGGGSSIVFDNGAPPQLIDLRSTGSVHIGTGRLRVDGSVSIGSSCNGAAATSTGGVCMTESTSAGWTPTSNNDYIRADSTLHNLVESINGGAEKLIGNVNTAQTNVFGAFLQDFSAATMEIPEAAGFTTNVDSTIGLDTTNNNVHLWVNSADSLAAAEASAIAANTIPKATDSTHSLLIASSLKDNGTTVTTTEPFGIGSTPPTACGSATGCLAFTEASTVGTPTTGQDYMRADSTAHSFLCSFNNAAETACGNGTVTSIATTSPITGGTITSTGTIACATCVTSVASLTNNALMTGAGLQASKTPVAGLVVNAATTGITNTANTGPGIIFNAVGNGILSEANGIFGITNGTAGGSGTIFGTISLIGTNDNVVDIIPPASTAWSIVRERHTIGQTGAGLALMTQDAVPISFRPNATESFQLPSAGGAVVKTGSMTSPLYATTTNCSSSASPAVCAAAPAGSVVIAAATTTITVNTTAVTANSQIFLLADDTLGTKLSVTCNSTLATLIGGLAVTARTGGTSFQITSGATPAVNPLCISYLIVN
jgi:hypothetical protein